MKIVFTAANGDKIEISDLSPEKGNSVHFTNVGGGIQVSFSSSVSSPPPSFSSVTAWIAGHAEVEYRSKIRAIKAVRQYCNIGLGEAKQLVDMHDANCSSVRLPSISGDRLEFAREMKLAGYNLVFE